MLTEREILDLLSEHLDDRLDAPTREAVDLGLRRSAELRSALAGLHKTVALLAGLPRVNAPAGFAEETAAKTGRIVMLNRAGRRMVARRGRSVMWGRAASIAAVLALCSLAAVAVYRAQSRIIENHEPAVAWNKAPTPDAENGALLGGNQSVEKLRKAVEERAEISGFVDVPAVGETAAATPPPAPERPSAGRSIDLLRNRPERANLELQQRTAAAAEPVRRAGVLTVAGETAKVLAVLDSALAGSGADASVRLSLRQARSPASGGAVSIPITSDDPLVIDRVVALLAESNDVRSLGFAPSAETVAADPRLRDQRLKDVKEADEAPPTALAFAKSAPDAAQAPQADGRKPENRADEPATGKKSAAPGAARTDNAAKPVAPTVRIDPSGKREIVADKPVEAAEREAKLAGAAGASGGPGGGKSDDKSRGQGGGGGVAATGPVAKAPITKAPIATGIAATGQTVAPPAADSKHAPTPTDKQAKSGVPFAGYKADGIAVGADPVLAKANGEARRLEEGAAYRGTPIERARQAQLGLLLGRLEKRLNSAAEDSDKNKDGTGKLQQDRAADAREPIRLSADQVRRQLLLLQLSPATAEKAKGAGAEATVKESGDFGKAEQAPAAPPAKTAQPQSAPLQRKRVTLVITIRPE